MTAKFLLAVLSLCPMFAFDATSEVAQLREALSRASAAHDADAFAKLLTPGFYATSPTGTIRDRDGALAHFKDDPPADLKIEPIRSVTYDGTVIQTNRHSWTANGTKHSNYTNDIFVKQDGSWKLAARFWTDIPPAK